MTGSTASIDMGLSSIVSLLQYIATEDTKTNTFLNSIKNSVTTLVDLSKDIFSFTSGNKLESYRKKKELREERNSFNLQTITEILLDQVHKPELTVKNAANKVLDAFAPNNTNIDKNVNIHIGGKLDSKGMKGLDSFMTKITEFVQIEESKFKAVEMFFKNLNFQLEILATKGKKAGTALALITGALVVLQFVSWVSIAKMAAVLMVVGIGFAFFFKQIVGSIANANFFKSITIMLFLPDILIAIGKSIIMFSIALLLFNFVGYEALLKFGLALGTLAVTWKYAFDRESVASFAWGIMSLSVSLLILTFALIRFKSVDWASVGMFLTFLVGLAAALRVSDKIVKRRNSLDTPLTALGLGLTLLLFALDMTSKISWQAAFVIITFIFSLGIVLSIFGGKGRGLGKGSTSSIISFAIGLTILVLALDSIGELDWVSITQLIVWMTVFSLALRLTTIGSGRTKLSGVMGFAIGLGILILALDAIGELDWTTIMQLTAWIIGISVALRIANGGKGKGSSMLMFALGLGLMVLAMDAMSELDEGTLLTTLLFLTGLGLAMTYFPTKIMWNMIILAGSLLIISLTLRMINNVSWDIKNLLTFVGAIVVLGGLVALMGIPYVAGLIGLGVVVGIGLSIGIWMMSVTINKVSKLNVTWGSIWDFVKTITTLSLTFVGLLPFLTGAALASILFLPIAASSLIIALAFKQLSKLKIDAALILKFTLAIYSIVSVFLLTAPVMSLAAISAIAFLPLALTSYLVAKTLFEISKLEIDNNKTADFGKAINLIALAWSKVGEFNIVKNAVKATAMLPLLATSYLATMVLNKISKIDVDIDKINLFSTSLKAVVDTYNQYGTVESLKLGVKATSMLPLVAIAYLSALTLEKITKIDVSKPKIDLFLDVLTYLTDSVLISLSNNEETLKKAKPGIEALAKLIGTFKSLGDVIQLMSKMKFYEMGVNSEGKLVYKSVRELTNTDMKNFAANIATLINTLVSPLIILGSDANEIVIGGKKFPNPFKNKQTLKGIEVIGKLGNAYKPLAESIITLSQSNILGDAKKTEEFMNSLTGISAVYLWFFKKSEKFRPKVITDVMKLIESYNSSINSLRVKHINDLNDIFASFMDKMTDDIKWRKIESNLISLKKHFKELSAIINTVNIQKADKFEKVVRALVDRQNGKGLVEAAQALRDILQQVNESYIKQQELVTKTLEAAEKVSLNVSNTAKSQSTTQNTFGVGSGVIAAGNVIPQQQVVQQVSSGESDPQALVNALKQLWLFKDDGIKLRQLIEKAIEDSTVPGISL